jgi:hypothetical protein
MQPVSALGNSAGYSVPRPDYHSGRSVRRVTGPRSARLKAGLEYVLLLT